MQVKPKKYQRVKTSRKEDLPVRFCVMCSIEITKNPRLSWKDYMSQKYCSRNCKGEAHSQIHIGESAPAYIDGRSSEAARLRGSSSYRRWRRSVFVRDDFTCQICGQRGGDLNADHIKPFALFEELRFDLSNGRTLCLSCHTDTPSYRAKRDKLKKIYAG